MTTNIFAIVHDDEDTDDHEIVVEVPVNMANTSHADFRKVFLHVDKRLAESLMVALSLWLEEEAIGEHLDAVADARHDNSRVWVGGCK